MNLNFQRLLLRLQISWERSKKGSFMNKFVWYQNFAKFKFSVTFEIWWFDAKWCQCGIVLNNNFDRNQKTCVKHFDEKSWVDERLMRNESKYVSIHAWWKLIGKHCRRKGSWWWDNENLIMVMMWMWNFQMHVVIMHKICISNPLKTTSMFSISTTTIVLSHAHSPVRFFVAMHS